MDKNIPVLDQSINRAKTGGPMATLKNRIEPYKEETKPLLSFPTEPVIKLLTHGITKPAPTLLKAKINKKGTSFSKIDKNP